MQAIAELLQVDNDVIGNTDHLYNVTMRRYACMALTNLTFADGANKALLCSMLPALRALVAQLCSPCEDLCQVTASVLRNLSWHSDLASKRALSEVDAAMTLMNCAMTCSRRESTLKSLLSAVWNLSSHGADNKADICSVPGALEFLVSLLSYRSPSKTLAVTENAGGILRNVSSHVAVRDDYRAVLRRAGCLPTLLRHLRSPSLTVVSNACGTLWNLSARCADDQSTLMQLGAVAMLKNLVHSRHRMISMGSAAALKNLLTADVTLPPDDVTRRSSDVTVGLHVRRQRAFEDELNRRQLTETCDDMDSPLTSPTSTLPSRSNSAFLATDSVRPRVQSPSPLRLSDRSHHHALRSSSHVYRVPVSHSSDEISACERRRLHSRRPSNWSSSSTDRVDEAQLMTHGETSSSSLHCPMSPTSFAHSRSRRFLKSSKTPTQTAPVMCASFLSERTENIRLDDLELKSSYDLDACDHSGSSLYHQTACTVVGQNSTNHLSDLYTDVSQTGTDIISLNDSSTAATARVDESVSERTSENESDLKTSGCLGDEEPQTVCTDNRDDITECCDQQCVVVFGSTVNSQQTPLNDDCLYLSMKSSTHSDVVSDIMDESFPNLTLSTTSDLQSSTDLLTADEVPTMTGVSSGQNDDQLVTTDDQARGLHVEGSVFDGVDCDVLCSNSDELMSLLEENANRVLRELELTAAEGSDVRLLEDETISLVSGHNDNEVDDDDEGGDDDDDDDYIDAISSRTYDVSSASGGDPAGLGSRYSSSRSLSSASDSPPATPVRRPRIVKPGDDSKSRQNAQPSAGEVKSVRGRRKALYSVTRPKIPPATQTSTRPSTAVKYKTVAADVPAVRRPSSASASSSRPPVVRPVVSKPASANNKAVDGASRRSVPTSNNSVSSTSSRVKQPTKPAAVNQSNVVKRPVDTRSESAANTRSTVSSSRTSSNQARPATATASTTNERPTAPVKQATFVKAGESPDETNINSNSISESSAPAPDRPGAVLPGTRDRSRQSSASSVRSNRPAVSVKPAAPGRLTTGSGAAGRSASASKVGLRHSSPSSVRAPPPSAVATKTSSPASASSAVRSNTRSVSAASPRRQQPPSAATTQTAGCESATGSGSVLTRTSTYDKLDDPEVSSVTTVIQSSTSPDSNESLVSSPPDSSAVVDSGQLSEAVIQRAKQLVEQADQIPTQRVSPAESIRLSSCLQLPDDVIERPSERELHHITDSEQNWTVTPQTPQTRCPQSASVDKPKPSPTRKFGFIGLWRRPRSDQTAAVASTSVDREKQTEKTTGTTSPRRRTFSWWRRSTSSSAAASGDVTATGGRSGEVKSTGRGFGRSAKDATCRAAVVTPFSYRPSTSPLFADLPESHQTKTAMLIERRMRRLKMASESSNEQSADCGAKSSATDVTSRRRNMLVTTV